MDQTDEQKAEAEAEAEVAAAIAKAEQEAAEAELAAMATEKPKRARKGKGEPALDHDHLRFLAETISAHETVSHPVFMGMVADLERDHGASFGEDGDDTMATFTMAGITARATHDRQAVVNWSNKARRVLLGVA